jgi:hypothetical protein
MNIFFKLALRGVSRARVIKIEWAGSRKTGNDEDPQTWVQIFALLSEPHIVPSAVGVKPTYYST